jgi:cytoskeletal protein RodZ
MITFLTIIFIIFSILLIFVVVYQYRIKNSLKGRQSPEKEKLLNWLVTGIGVVFFVVVFLLAFAYNRQAMQEKAVIEDLSKTSTQSISPQQTAPEATPAETTQPGSESSETQNTNP